MPDDRRWWRFRHRYLGREKTLSLGEFPEVGIEEAEDHPKHHAALTNPKDVGKLLNAIDGYAGFSSVMSALRLAPLVFLRPGELRGAEWSEIDLEAGEWRIPAVRMKMKQDHIVPLSRQAIAIT
jgi:integrase